MTLTEGWPTVWGKAARDAVRGAKYHVQATVITWLVAGVAAGEVPVAPRVAQTGMLILCLFFYTAAAAKARGLSGDGTFWLGISRPGTELAPLFMTLFMALLIGAGLVGGYFAGEEVGAYIGAGVGAPICLLITARIWPLFSVSYFFKGTYKWTGQGMIWSGPGLGLSVRLTGRRKGRRYATPLFMTALLVFVGIIGGIRVTFGSGFIVNLLLYAVALPYLSTLNLMLTDELLMDHFKQEEEKNRSAERPGPATGIRLGVR